MASEYEKMIGKWSFEKKAKVEVWRQTVGKWYAIETTLYGQQVIIAVGRTRALAMKRMWETLVECRLAKEES